MCVRIALFFLLLAVLVSGDCDKKPPCKERGCGFPMCPIRQAVKFDERVCCCPYCVPDGSAASSASSADASASAASAPAGASAASASSADASAATRRRDNNAIPIPIRELHI